MSKTQTEIQNEITDKMATLEPGEKFGYKLSVKGMLNLYPFKTEIIEKRLYKIERIL